MMWFADGPWRGGPPGGGLCLLLGLLLLGGLLFAAWAFWRRANGPESEGADAKPGSGKAKHSPAEDVLADRYARGDLTDEEYWERLSVLRESRNGRD